MENNYPFDLTIQWKLFRIKSTQLFEMYVFS